MKKILMILACVVLPQLGFAAPSVAIDFRFTDAATSELSQGHASVLLPQAKDKLAFTDPKLGKTLQVIELANIITTHLDEYAKASCGPAKPLFCPNTPYPRNVQPFPSDVPAPAMEVCERQLDVAAKLNEEIESYTANLLEFGLQDSQIDAALAIVEDLVANMESNAKFTQMPCYFEETPFPGLSDAASSAATGSSALHVTAGGAQNYAYFKKIVDEGKVPESLVVEGFLSEFDLSLQDDPCDKLICVFPEVALDKRKLFVQVGMSSQQTADAFKRKPLNLSIVLDISGSMSATDGTKQTRLDWAKDALYATVAQLHENDLLSIVLFDTTSEILVRPAVLSNKDAIIALIKGIQTKGSTNLEAGLRDGYNLVSEHVSPSYENRVILISDAGLNTGITNTAELLRLVTDHAADSIGLTAIGMGSNFQEDFIHAISRSKGGNYLFVQSGSDLEKYFAKFDYLVTPIAYAFKASLTLHDIKAKLVKTYGIPMSEDAELKDIFDIQTLFFSEAGGAIVLEYELEDR